MRITKMLGRFNIFMAFALILVSYSQPQAQSWTSDIQIKSIVFKKSTLYYTVVSELINKGSKYLDFISPQFAFFDDGSHLIDVDETYLSSDKYGSSGVGLAPGDTGYFYGYLDTVTSYQIAFTYRASTISDGYQFNSSFLSVSDTRLLNKQFSCKIKNVSGRELNSIYAHLLLYHGDTLVWIEECQIDTPTNLHYGLKAGDSSIVTDQFSSLPIYDSYRVIGAYSLIQSSTVAKSRPKATSELVSLDRNKISFEIKEKEFVRIRLMALDGKIIKILLSYPFRAGKHVVDLGAFLPSNLMASNQYLVEVDIGPQKAALKMSLK